MAEAKGNHRHTLTGRSHSPAPPLTRCEAYDTLSGLFDAVRSSASALQRQEQSFTKKDMMELYRGTMVRILTTWEGYLHDLTEELFTRLYEQASSRTTDAALSQWRRNVVATAALPAAGDSLSEKQRYELSVLLTDSRAREEKLRTTLLNSAINKFKTPTLRNYSDAIATLLGEQKEFDFASIVFERMKNIGLTFRVGGGRNGIQPFKIATKNSMEELLSLFYGIRCVFAHGSARNTVENGALSVVERAEFNTNNPHVSAWICRQRQNALQYGTDVHVSFLFLLNCLRFVRQLARATMIALNNHVKARFGVELWPNPNPRGAQEETEEDNEDYVSTMFDEDAATH